MLTLFAAASIAAAPAPPLGDPARGAGLYRFRCGFCHAPDADRFGPRHRGVYGARVASVSGFRYSAALRAQSFTWTEARLDQWLADPLTLVPGAAMQMRTASPRDRADLIAYLRSLGPVRP